MSQEIVIQSWPDLCEKLYIDSWKEPLQRFRTDFAYRGLSDKNYELSNGFYRTCGDCSHLEYHILRNFRKYARFGKTEDFSSEWQVMTMGQHYGLPTRLIDWTYSPFVAVHFATQNTDRYDTDGIIWMVDFVNVNRLLPLPLQKALNKVGSNTFTIEMMEMVVPTIEEFDTMSEELMLLFFEPPSLDARIENQYAFFSVMSDPVAIMDKWLEKHPGLFYKLIIPKGLKWEIRDKLDQANITERLLFPGLDGLASWLKRHYTPV
ncbi:MAG TPA: FRG domain-containing protein [Cytophagales bacterium]|jgi:hypothetical protein|nr:FRG domain-containing protein [Cytophagales bacterium]